MATLLAPVACQDGGQGSTTDRERARTAAIDKAMILYEALRSTPHAQRLSDLSRRTGFAKSTTHRLLGALTASGMVTRLGVGYVAVTRPADVTRTAGRQRDLLRRLAPYVCDALVRTTLTASLAVLDGPDVTFAHRAYSHGNVPTTSDHTGRDLAHRTVAGRLLLSHDVSGSCDAARAWGLGDDEVALLRYDLTLIRRRGFAVNAADDVTCVAVGLPVRSAGSPVALAVKGPARAVDVERTVLHLRGVVTSVRTAFDAAHNP